MTLTPVVNQRNMFATAETSCSYEMFVVCAIRNVHRFTNHNVYSDSHTRRRSNVNKYDENTKTSDSVEKMISRIDAITKSGGSGIRIFRHFVTSNKMNVFIRVLLSAANAFVLSNPLLGNAAPTAQNTPDSVIPTAPGAHPLNNYLQSHTSQAASIHFALDSSQLTEISE